MVKSRNPFMAILPSKNVSGTEHTVRVTVRVSKLVGKMLRVLAERRGYELSEAGAQLFQWGLDNLTKDSVFPQPVLPNAKEHGSEQITIRFRESQIVKADDLARAKGGHLRSTVLTNVLSWAVFEAFSENDA